MAEGSGFCIKHALETAFQYVSKCQEWRGLVNVTCWGVTVKEKKNGLIGKTSRKKDIMAIAWTDDDLELNCSTWVLWSIYKPEGQQHIRKERVGNNLVFFLSRPLNLTDQFSQAVFHTEIAVVQLSKLSFYMFFRCLVSPSGKLPARCRLVRYIWCLPWEWWEDRRAK